MIITLIIGVLFIVAGLVVLEFAETRALGALNEANYYRELERWAGYMIGGILLLMSGIAILGYVAGYV